MFGREMVKHIREFGRYVANYKFEKTPSGVYFPQAKAMMQGTYAHRVNDGPWEYSTNLIPDEGLNLILGWVVNTSGLVSTWYMALYQNAYTPLPALDAGNFAGTAGENTSTTEGYTEANRVAWVPDAIDTVNTEVTNDTTTADFTIATATTVVMNGAALLSTNTRGGTTGSLLSASRFAAARNLSNGDTFSVKYKIDVDAV